MLGNGVKGEGHGLLRRRGKELDQLANCNFVGCEIKDGKPLLRPSGGSNPAHFLLQPKLCVRGCCSSAI